MFKKIFSQHDISENIDDPQVTIKRKDFIKDKPFLFKLYCEWYSLLAGEIPNGEGKVLELGSGGGFMQEVIPGVITSEVMDIANVDQVIDACHELPFADGELNAILMVDVLHHLPDVASFFSLAEKKLRAGGRIVMIEPWNSFWARLVYMNLHHEPYNLDAEEWSFPSTGPLSGANGALPWIVFSRDYAKFRQHYPTLTLVNTKKLMPLAYLFSGGVSMRSFLPGCLYNSLRFLERVSGLEAWQPMFALLSIEKAG
jgi:SAM-dependent methyltransferase